MQRYIIYLLCMMKFIYTRTDLRHEIVFSVWINRTVLDWKKSSLIDKILLKLYLFCDIILLMLFECLAIMYQLQNYMSKLKINKNVYKLKLWFIPGTAFQSFVSSIRRMTGIYISNL